MALTKITAAGLTADLIDETKLADNSIDSEHYNDGSIDNAHLADDAVGIDELSATGTAGNTTYLRGDNTWAVPPDTNTVYTHPNHSGEVTSTADGAQVVADDVIDEANLKVDNSPTNDYVLTAKSSAAGGLTWAAASGGISDVVSDTSPQLGGNLDVNGNDITGDAIDFHAADGQVIAKLHKTNSSEFYFNNSKKLEVTNGGISVTGSATLSSGAYIGGSGGGNHLDDYEEGTWTPQIRFGNGAPSGVTYSGSNNGGVYTKIGRLIMCIGEINLTSKGTSTGYFAITGFPYNEGNYGGNLSKAHSSIGHYYNMNNWERWFGLDMFGNDDVAIFRGGNNSNTNNDRNNSDVNDNTNIQFAVTYFTDE